MTRDTDGFDRSVRLPPALSIGPIRNAINYVEKQAEELIDLYYEQANLFSGLIGILGVRALQAYSPYKRHKHPDIAQQRFPDLSLDGRLSRATGKLDCLPTPTDSSEEGKTNSRQ